MSLGSIIDEILLVLQYNLDMGYLRFIMFLVSGRRLDNGISAGIAAALQRQISKVLHVRRFVIHV